MKLLSKGKPFECYGVKIYGVLKPLLISGMEASETW